jgi:hypothetical protein
MEKRIEVTLKGRYFTADAVVEQQMDFGDCHTCDRQGLKTIVAIEEIRDSDTMEIIVARSKIGLAIEKAISDAMDGKYICARCLGYPCTIDI